MQPQYTKVVIVVSIFFSIILVVFWFEIKGSGIWGGRALSSKDLGVQGSSLRFGTGGSHLFV